MGRETGVCGQLWGTWWGEVSGGGGECVDGVEDEGR